MKNLTVYFRIDGELGGTLDLGTASKDISYQQLVKNINIAKFADMLGLSGHEIQIVTPEEYAAEFGGEEKNVGGESNG